MKDKRMFVNCFLVKLFFLFSGFAVWLAPMTGQNVTESKISRELSGPEELLPKLIPRLRDFVEIAENKLTNFTTPRKEKNLFCRHLLLFLCACSQQRTTRKNFNRISLLLRA